VADEPGIALDLPEPGLVVLVGAAGSGKSTLAARLFEPSQVLSSDAYRAIVSGDEGNQAATRVAFKVLHHELDRRLAAGRTTVIDATNVTSHARRSLLRRAAAHGVPAVAIVLDLPAELVQARNALRGGRIVPAAAVREQLAALERALRRDEFGIEGYAAIHRLRTPAEVEALQVRRPAG
jgi:protein phosphatase